MNLLGAKLYDPSSAAAKATSSLIAMTAFDTTNLRLTVTVPAHGFLFCRMRCQLEGATTFPQVLLGCMNGAAIVARVTPVATIGATALATTRVTLTAEFVIPGLAPGSITLDAAYGVEIVLAATNIKYGGPNDTTTDNAWGAFVFELWDPQPLPTAAPGAANGVFIAGTNAATSVTTGFTAHIIGTVDTVTTLTNLPAITANWLTAAGTAADFGTEVAAAVWQDAVAGDFTVASSIGKALYIANVVPGAAGGHFIAGTNAATSITTGLTANIIGTLSTLTTYTGNTPQTGDTFARIGVAGAGLTALGDSRIANLDATVSSRLTPAGTLARVTLVDTLTTYTNAADGGGGSQSSFLGF